MGRGHSTTSSLASSLLSSPSHPSLDDANSDLDLEFDPTFPPPLNPSIPPHHLRLTAYDLLFSLCRSSPGFAFTTDPDHDDPSPSPVPSFAPHRPANAQKSRTKRLLSLNHHRSRSLSSSPGRQAPISLAHLLRLQLRIPDHHDRNLRKTLNRAHTGHVARRPDSFLLPLEHLRHLRPHDFPHLADYHSFQRRQLHLLEATFLPHSDGIANPHATRLRDIVRSAESRPIDTGKGSDVVRTLANCTASLVHRPHWAGRYPLNLHLYVALLGAVFDTADGAFVLDEADELLELMRRTWAPLGLGRAVHGVCLAWVLFRQFVVTGQAEPELLRASLGVVSGLSRKGAGYGRVAAGAMAAMQGWAERRLMDYHESFAKGGVGGDGNYMETLVELAIVAATKVAEVGQGGGGEGMGNGGGGDMSRNRVDYYIRSSVTNAFNKMIDESITDEGLIRLARDAEELAAREKERFGPMLRRWHPAPAAAAAAILHGCYGAALRQYVAGVVGPTREAIGVLCAAGRLEKVLLQMVADDDGGGEGVEAETTLYEVEATVVRLVRNWVEERLKAAKECLNKAKEIETWIPVSKTEAYAGSAVELLQLARNAIDEFVVIPVTGHDELASHLVDDLKSVLLEYISFVASCGDKENYIPTLPPLTRCNQDSAFYRFWRCASPCRIDTDQSTPPPTFAAPSIHDHPRPSTSRGTQRLYVRLNTLHHLLGGVECLDKSLALYRWRRPLSAAVAASRFEAVRSAAQAAIHHTMEVVGHRLMFLDSSRAFYEGLYYGGVARARARPALRLLKQNLSVMVTVVAEAAREAAVRAVMRAAFEAFLYVILAGGPERAFVWSDYEMVMEDLNSLKRVFITCCENLVTEDVVDREAAVVEGVVSLMSLPTEQLIEDFNIVACEAIGLGTLADGVATNDQKVPIPRAADRWNRMDPDTVLRVLCHRDDEAADRFLKRTFQLPRRR